MENGRWRMASGEWRMENGANVRMAGDAKAAPTVRLLVSPVVQLRGTSRVGERRGGVDKPFLAPLHTSFDVTDGRRSELIYDPLGGTGGSLAQFSQQGEIV